MADPMDPRTSDPWESTIDPATGQPWRSSLAEALRANGFEVAPPPLDDDPDEEPERPTGQARPTTDAPAADPVAEAGPALDVDPGEAWWLDGAALPPSLPGAAPVVPLLPQAPIEAPEMTAPAAPAMIADGATAGSSTGGAAVPPRAATAPATLGAAVPPSPPAFLAGRIARPTAPAPGIAPAPDPVPPSGWEELQALSTARSAPHGVSPAPTAWPDPAAPAAAVTSAALPDDDRPSGAPFVVAAGALGVAALAADAQTPDAPEAPLDEPDHSMDPRAAIAWPEPQPLDDERWLDAPKGLVPDAPVAAAGDPRGFAFGHADDDAHRTPTPSPDPWADVRSSATDDAAPATADLAAPSPDADLEALRAQASASLAADAAAQAGMDPRWPTTDVAPDADATMAEAPTVMAAPWGSPVPWDAAQPTAVATDGDVALRGDVASAEHPAPADPAVPASWDVVPPESAASDAADAPDRAAPPTELPAWDAWPATPTWVSPPVAPELERATPAIDSVEPVLLVSPPGSDVPAPPAVLSDAAPMELDPQRVEFIGYTEPPVAPAVDGTVPQSRPPTAPTGSILDVGRRPPGARPVDPATLSAGAAATAAAAAAPSAGPTPSTPGATGGDLWDLVTAPPATRMPPGASEGRGSRLVTLLLTLLVALVIVALVVGFLYSFTSLL